MRKPKKVGILTVAEAKKRVRDYKVKIAGMKKRSAILVERYKNETDVGVMSALRTEIKSLNMSKLVMILEVQKIETGLSLITMLQQGYEVWVN